MKNSDEKEDFSSIKRLEKVVHLALPITFVSNEKAGVIEILDSWIRQYNQQLEGILVSYSNVYLVSRANYVIYDKLCVQVDVKATFEIFCPTVGDVIKGRINRISKEHIGCLMHDTINVVIKLTDYYPEELSKFIRHDQDILFEITHFDCQKREVRVKGKITPHCLELMNELFPVFEEDIITNFSFQNQNTITRYDFDDVNGVDSINHDITDVPSVVENITDLHQTEKSKKRKRDASPSDQNHRKKKKRKKEKNGKIPKEEKKKSKKGKIVASGTVLKADKKKHAKKKHSKKDSSKMDKKLKSRTKNKHAKGKSKHEHVFNHDTEIKFE